MNEIKLLEKKILTLENELKQTQLKHKLDMLKIFKKLDNIISIQNSLIEIINILRKK